MQINYDTSRRILKRAQVVKRLGKTVFMDARSAGWIRPAAVKPPNEGSKRISNASVFFLTEDIEKVEHRIAGGEYPIPATNLK